MIVVELQKYNLIESAVYSDSFVLSAQPGRHTTADYWVNTFGAPDESDQTTKFIDAVRGNYNDNYQELTSYASVVSTEKSFYWDNDNQLLYIHLDHDENIFTTVLEYGDQIGYNDKYDIFIDDVFYSSDILSFPSLSQQQDLQNYDKLALMKGALVLKNHEAKNEFLIETNVFGNDVKIYYLADDGNTSDWTRSDLQRLQTFTVDDFTIGISEITLNIQDKRTEQDIDIPVDVFETSDYPDIDSKYVGKYIPVAYGTITASEGIPIDGETGSGTVTFRQSISLTSLGTVQVLVDDVWETKTPISTDLSTGSFTLSEANGRQSSGAPYECRVLGSVGISITYTSDIIKDLNERYLNRPYNSTNYNTTEWEAEEVQLSSGGYLINKKIKLFEAIRQIQDGSIIGFRYEINAEGKRTIRIDDWERTESGTIDNIDYTNTQEIPVESDRQLLAAKMRVNYAKDYFDDVFSFVTDDQYQDQVRQDYRWENEVEIDTILSNQADAESKQSWYYDRYKDIPKITILELRGAAFFGVRIYDVFTAALTPGVANFDDNSIEGREYYGINKVQILSIDPNYQSLTNTVTAVIIEKLEEVTTARIAEDDVIRIVDSSSGLIRSP